MRRMRLIGCLMLVWMLAVMPVLAVEAADMYPGGRTFGVVANSKLNLRERPNTSSRILGTYAYGTWVQITNTTFDGQFYEVFTMDGKHGYMMTSLLNRDVCTKGALATVQGTGTYVNLRRAPTTNASVIHRVPRYSQVEILEYGLIFARVRLENGNVGYMSAGLLRMPGQTSWEETYLTSRNGGRVNLRSGPGVSYPPIGSYAPGTKMIVLIRGTNWHKVAIGNQLGYMSADFVGNPYRW